MELSLPCTHSLSLPKPGTGTHLTQLPPWHCWCDLCPSSALPWQGVLTCQTLPSAVQGALRCSEGMTDVMCPSPLPSATFGMPDPAFLPAPGGLPKGDARGGAIPGTSPKCQLPHRSPWHCRLRRGRVSVSSTAWLSPLRGKPGSPLTLRGTGERPSRGWGSFSVSLSLTFNENKQAGMGRRCGRAAWPCAGRWPRTAASTAQALHKDGQSRGGAGSDAIPWGEAARGEKPGGGRCPRQLPGWDSARRWGEPGGCVVSRQGRRLGLHAGSGRLGWNWALQRAGLPAPHGPGTGMEAAGWWAPGMVLLWMLLRTSPASPAPAALPVWLMLCIHLGTHLGTGTGGCPGSQHSLVTPLQPQLCRPGCGWLQSHLWVPIVGQPCHHTWESLMLLVP